MGGTGFHHLLFHAGWRAAPFVLRLLWRLRRADAGRHRWAGLGGHWAGKDDPAFPDEAPLPLPAIVLAHNPDSAVGPAGADVSLVLAGHTRYGQIRLPWLYRRVTPGACRFDPGGKRIAGTAGRSVRVFTTAGIGEVGLPLRLFNPPTIDMLELRK